MFVADLPSAAAVRSSAAAVESPKLNPPLDVMTVSQIWIATLVFRLHKDNCQEMYWAQA